MGTAICLITFIKCHDSMSGVALRSFKTKIGASRVKIIPHSAVRRGVDRIFQDILYGRRFKWDIVAGTYSFFYECHFYFSQRTGSLIEAENLPYDPGFLRDRFEHISISHFPV